MSKIKTCGSCKKDYPATLEYFFKKVTKAGTIIHGRVLKNDSVSLKHICKTCHAKKTLLFVQKKRAKELNMSLEEYQANSQTIGRDERRIKKLKYIEFKDLPPKECSKNVRRMNAGYTLEDLKNYEAVKKERIKQKRINSRKYDYSEFGDMYPLTNAVASKKMREANAPSMIALNMHIPVKDLTPELLELGIKSVNLYRQVKSLITN
jgi:hypothetical protein